MRTKRKVDLIWGVSHYEVETVATGFVSFVWLFFAIASYFYFVVYPEVFFVIYLWMFSQSFKRFLVNLEKCRYLKSKLKSSLRNSDLYR